MISLPSLPPVDDLCPATLSALPVDAAQLARLAAMRAADREHDLGRMMYAHLYHETCRRRLVARLHSHVDRELQEHWQAHRAAFIERAHVDCRNASTRSETPVAEYA